MFQLHWISGTTSSIWMDFHQNEIITKELKFTVWWMTHFAWSHHNYNYKQWVTLSKLQGQIFSENPRIHSRKDSREQNCEGSKWIHVNLSVLHTIWRESMNSWTNSLENPNGFLRLVLNFWPWVSYIMYMYHFENGHDLIKVSLKCMPGFQSHHCTFVFAHLFSHKLKQGTPFNPAQHKICSYIMSTLK